MPQITVNAFEWLADAEGWATTYYGWYTATEEGWVSDDGSPDNGCYKLGISGESALPSGVTAAARATVRPTWASLGVPANATVTHVAAQVSYKVATATQTVPYDTATFLMQFGVGGNWNEPAPGSSITFIDHNWSLPVATTGWTTVSDAGANVTGNWSDPDTTVYLSFRQSIAWGSNGAASLLILWDTFKLTIDYTLPGGGETSGTLSETLDPLTIAADGDVEVHGMLVGITLDAVSLARSATFAATLDPLTLSATDLGARTGESTFTIVLTATGAGTQSLPVTDTPIRPRATVIGETLTAVVADDPLKAAIL